MKWECDRCDSMCEASRRGRCRNSDVRERCGLKGDVVIRIEKVFNSSRRHLEEHPSTAADTPLAPDGTPDRGFLRVVADAHLDLYRSKPSVAWPFCLFSESAMSSGQS
ncbi:hypothetical protein EVAR_50477_1 [Eumeta japonica]|uniref:Uncharacterized protein n=1 Tax=Eumeta variegata TaxID=151549 RepID=A0A4C1XUI6_EUMVA|nr:hypothetical protein EVAR_50477_1 [Eumeta japonica]